LDYQDVPLKKSPSKIKGEEEKLIKKHAEEKGYEQKYTRLDGKQITKQLGILYEKDKKSIEEQEKINKFDPRKH
jgi:hypothetical protein